MGEGIIRTAFALFAAWAAIVPGRARAEFIPVTPLTFATLDTVVIASSTKDVSGIYVFAFHKPQTTALNFDPGSTKPDEGKSIFITLKNGRYEEVLVGSKRYASNGRFTLRLNSSTSVEVNNTGGASYLTVQSGERDLIGFRELERVVNTSDAASATLLAANQLNMDGIQPYVLTPEGLALGGELVRGNRVGVSVTTDNPCLTAGMRVIPEEALQDRAALATATEESLKQKFTLLSEYLTLSATPTMVVAIDPTTGALVSIKPGGKNYCVSAPVA